MKRVSVRINSVLEVAGLSSITAGAAMVYRPAGFIVGGVLAVGYSVLGYLAGKG